MRRLAWFGFPFAAAIFLGVYLGGFAIYAAVAVGVIALAAAMFAKMPQRARIRLASAGLAIGAAWFLLYNALFIAPKADFDGYIGIITATATGYADTYYDQISFPADIVTEDGRRARVTVSARDGGEPIAAGDTFTAFARLTFIGPSPYAPPLTCEVAGAVELTGRNIAPKHVPAIIAHALGNSIARVYDPAAAPFVRAITLAQTDDLQNDTLTQSALRRSGASHITAVSGMHVTFLIALVTKLTRNKKVLAFAGVPILFLFMAITGFTPSVTRAVLMQTIVLLAPLVKRRADGVTSVAFALTVLLLVAPYDAAAKSTQLSFLATLGLVTVTGRVYAAIDRTHAAQRLKNRRITRIASRFVVTSFAASVGALAFTTPLTAYYFGTVSLLAPLTNLAVLWAASFAFCGGLIAGVLGLISVTVGTVAATVAALPAQYILWAVRTIARIPYCAVYVSNPLLVVWLGYVYVAFTALIVLRGNVRQAIIPLTGAVVTLILALTLHVTLTRYGGLTVAALDVGQGQCIVVTRGSYTAVIDCGSSTGSVDAASVADEYLQSVGVRRIDALYLTHFDYDHVSGVAALLKLYDVGALIIPEPTEFGGDAIVALAISAKTDIIITDTVVTFPLGGAAITVYPPFNVTAANTGNALLIADGRWETLVTGDMDWVAELMLTELYDLPDIELLVVGHHGSKYSTYDWLLDAVTPEYAIISSGIDNTYGHPTPETLNRLYARGISVYRTDENGNVVIQLTMNN
ncbi:MAG: DNA internalization-related competence protein ComEC/Rec2 [Oscillospiraceae bacterium]|nr:DNA internalization-related competence protein ComEC/Rec2 [Oscillospiraceae bacterium]